MSNAANDPAWLSARLQALQTDLEVLRPLGAGTTSNVYLAREPALLARRRHVGEVPTPSPAPPRAEHHPAE